MDDIGRKATQLLNVIAQQWDFQSSTLWSQIKLLWLQKETE